MAAADYTLLAEYAKRSVVKERNYVGLNNWAYGISIQPIPEQKPEESWVKERIVSERIPQQPDSYVQRTLSYFLQDAATQTNIREYLTDVNTEAAETALAGQVDSVILAFMPRFAAIDVTDKQVEDWLTEHGFPIA